MSSPLVGIHLVDFIRSSYIGVEDASSFKSRLRLFFRGGSENFFHSGKKDGRDEDLGAWLGNRESKIVGAGIVVVVVPIGAIFSLTFYSKSVARLNTEGVMEDGPQTINSNGTRSTG